jgi:hypothetical protein
MTGLPGWESLRECSALQDRMNQIQDTSQKHAHSPTQLHVGGPLYDLRNPLFRYVT